MHRESFKTLYSLAKANYFNLGVGLLGHILSLKAGIPYEQLVRDRILNVLGMDSTGIAINSTQITTPLPDLLKSRLAKGHVGGKEISSLTLLPEVIQPSGVQLYVLFIYGPGIIF